MIVIHHVEFEMVEQRLDLLGRAPSSAKQAIDVGPQHGASVVEAKKRVIADFFKLSLPRNGPALPLVSDVRCRGKKLLYIGFVMRVFVGLDQGG